MRYERRYVAYQECEYEWYSFSFLLLFRSQREKKEREKKEFDLISTESLATTVDLFFSPDLGLLGKEKLESLRKKVKRGRFVTVLS